ncbi:MAG: dockerin type I domain-containing protein [Planctomycetota bacterium]|jgi:alpha-amylase
MNRRIKIKKSALTFALFLVIAAVTTRSLFAGGQPLNPDSVVFQTFYWNVPEGGNWYNTIAGKADELKSAGFTHFWFPPPTKGASGGYSMGYDLYDHYDLGNYDQKGTVETRFGSLSELQAAAAACENVLLDLVANHMAGAEAQCDDPCGNWQVFQYVHSNFWKSCSDFHPGYPDDCDLCNGNDYVMGEDICHNPYMYNGLRDWASWLKTTVPNVSGFRLDAVKHFIWDMSREFGNIGSCIGEYWDSKDNILNWMAYTGNYAFDFPLYYTMKDEAAAALDGAGLTSDRGVSFVANHDTDRDTDGIYQKSRAYGFIMYITPVPCVFWSDWLNLSLQPDIRRALDARRSFDFSGTKTIYKTTDFIIFRNNGPVFGCFNSAGSGRSGTIKAAPNQTYTAIAWGPGSKPADVTSDADGDLTLNAPAGGYCYWYGSGYASKYDAIYVPGDNEQVFGIWWNFSQANRMKSVADYTWRWETNVSQPTPVEYKFAMNGSWSINRGLGNTSGPDLCQHNSNLTQNGANIPANLPRGICIWEYYENTETGRLYTVDFNADGNINLADLSFLAGYWGNRNCGQSNCCNGTDLNNDGSVDPFDLARLLEYWLRGIGP